MRKINKIVNIALIFMLIGMLVCQEAYCLRVPVDVGNDREELVMLELLMTKMEESLGSMISHISGGKPLRIAQEVYSINLILEKYNIPDIDTGDLTLAFGPANEKLKTDGKPHSIKDAMELIAGDTQKYVALINRTISDLMKKNTFSDEDKSEIVDMISEIAELENKFLKVIDLFTCSDVNDIVKKLLLYYGKTPFEFIPHEESLIFDRIIENDAIAIVHTIDNCLSNTMSAMDKRKSEDEANIFIKTLKEDGAIKIEISDNGQGISRKILPHIFKEGFTTAESLKDRHGLGLYLSLQYLVLLNKLGKKSGIQVDTMANDGVPRRLIFDDKLEKITILENDGVPIDSNKRKEQGTTFTVWLPLASEQGAERKREKAITLIKKVQSLLEKYPRITLEAAASELGYSAPALSIALIRAGKPWKKIMREALIEKREVLIEKPEVLIKKVQSLLEKYPRITLEAAASELGYSAPALSIALIRAGKTWKERKAEVLIKKVQSLLEEDLHIGAEEAAIALGYNRQSLLSSALRSAGKPWTEIKREVLKTRNTKLREILEGLGAVHNFNL